MGRARTCTNLLSQLGGRATHYSTTHQEPGGGLEPPTFALRGRCSCRLSYPGVGEEPRAGVEPAAARYNVAALPHERSRLGLGGGPRSRTAGLEGQHAACLRRSQASCAALGVPIACRRHYGWFVVVGHPLLESNVKSAIESAASRHLGRRWVSHAFTDLNERASHPCGVLHGEPFSVFAKLDIGDNAEEKFQAELSGLTLLRDRARIAIPTPIGTGLLQLDHGSLLLTEALSERPPKDRTPDDWRAIGHTLATLHQVQRFRRSFSLAVPRSRWRQCDNLLDHRRCDRPRLSRSAGRAGA